MPSRETQQILIFESLILPAQGYNPRSTTLEASNRFGRVMVSVFAWRAADREFDPNQRP